MERFLTGPGLPTAAFAAVTLLDVMGARGVETVLLAAPIVTSLVVVPLAWRAFVLRPGCACVRRAMLAGATSGLLISISLPLLASFLHDPHRHYPAGSWASTGALGTIMGFWGATLFAAPVGALLGALVERVRQRWSRAAAAGPTADASNRDGMLGGVMVAILCGPVLSILGVALLPLQLRILATAENPATRLFVTWYVLIPVGAWAGASRRKPAERRAVV